MAKLEWPPEKTFKYVFSKELEMEITAFDTPRKEISKEEEQEI